MAPRTLVSTLGVILSLAAVFLFAQGCIPPLPSIQTGTITVTFRATLGASARSSAPTKTILPATDMAAASYDVSGTGPDGSTFSLTGLTGSSTGAITVAVGDWTVTVNASNASGTVIGSGSETVRVGQGEGAVVTVTVVPLVGVGTLSLEASLPPGVITNPAIQGNLTPEAGGAPIAVEFTISQDKTSASYVNVSMPTGYYTLSLQLKDGQAALSPPFVDTVRILKDQTTAGTITFSYNSATGAISVSIVVDLQPPIVITFSGLQPTIPLGTAISVTASGSQAVTSWQWYFNGTPIPGYTTDTLAIPGNALPIGTYRFDVLAHAGVVVCSSGFNIQVVSGAGGTETKTVTWSASQVVTSVTRTGGVPVDASVDAAQPSVVVDGSTLLVAYTTGAGLQLAESTNGASTWSTQTLFPGQRSAVSLVKAGTRLLLISNLYGTVEVAFSDNHGVTWTAESPLTLAGVSSMDVVTNGASVFVAVADGSQSPVVSFLKSTDSGGTWSSPVTVSSEIAGLQALGLAVDGSRLYISYRLWDPQNGTIRFISSTDAGSTWSVSTLAATYYPFDTSIIAEGSSLSMAYSNDSGYLHSSDYGATWSAKTTFDNVFVVGSRLVRLGSTVAVVYYDWGAKALKFARSSDGGGTWSARTIDASAGNDTGQLATLSVAVAGSTVTIAYIDARRGLLVQQSADGGATWLSVSYSVPVSGRLVDATPGAGDYVAEAADGNGHVWLAYGSRRQLQSLRVARSADNGATWESGTLDGYGGLIAMRYAEGTLYLTWANGGTLVGTSVDGGTTWAVTRVDDANGNGDGDADILVNGQTILVAYKAYTWSGTTGQSQLRIARSPDGGATWSSQTVDPSCRTFLGTSLAIVGSVYVVAYDDGAGHLRVASSTNGGSTWTPHATSESFFDSVSLAAAGNTLWAATGGNLLTSEDGGSTWSVSAFDTLASPSDPCLAAAGGSLYISSYDAGTRSLTCAVSNNGGISWTTTVVDPDAFGTRTAIAVRGTMVMLGYASAMDLGAKFDRSDNGGSSYLW